ncbi:MAG: M24 family metallopeptidase [Candidatus Hodarchaeota archaeon]
MFDFKKRLENLQEKLEYTDLSAVVLLNTRNIYWVSGTAQSSQLIIPKGKDPILMVKRNIDLARQHSWFPGEWIKPLRSTKETIQVTLDNIAGIGNKVGMELGGLPTSLYFKFQQGFGDSIILENVSNHMRELRIVKDRGEIEKVKNAAKVAEKTQDVVYEMTVENFKPGTTERDIAAEMIRVAKKNRSEHYCIYDNNMFTNFNNFFIVTSGEALWTPSTFPIMSGSGYSPAIPYGPSDRVLKEGDMVVCDYAVLVDGYHADHARSYTINGVLPANYKERYLNLKLAYERTLDIMQDGVPVNELFIKMENELKRLDDPDPSLKIEKYFEGNGDFYQGFGHGIGLELDEPPFILKNNDYPLKENMIISLEPKIMIPGWGAINFEDNFLIKKDKKPEILTRTRYLEF